MLQRAQRYSSGISKPKVRKLFYLIALFLLLLAASCSDSEKESFNTAEAQRGTSAPERSPPSAPSSCGRLSHWEIRGKGREDIEPIFLLLFPEFARIYGVKVMTASPCIIYNDPKADNPLLITNRPKLQIRLSQTSTSYWAQQIFQLSHELCHYAHRHSRDNGAFKILWFEEIVCEAVSLYALEYCHLNWGECTLSRMNFSFSKHIYSYLIDEIKDPHCSDLLECALRDGWLGKYERLYATDRASHVLERNFLYLEIRKHIKAHPEYLRDLCNYPRYALSDLTDIDFQRWYSETKNPLVLLFARFRDQSFYRSLRKPRRQK